MNTYLSSLKVIFDRDLASDTFVIKTSASYLMRSVENVYNTEPDTIAIALRELDAFLNSEKMISFQLEAAFLSADISQCYNTNLKVLRELKDKLEGILDKKKEARRPLIIS